MEGGALDWSAAFTVDGWFYLPPGEVDISEAERPLFVWGSGSAEIMRLVHNGLLNRVSLLWSTGAVRHHPVSVSEGWVHVGLSYDSSADTVTFAVGGQSLTRDAPADLVYARSACWLGIGGAEGEALTWPGTLDGVRVSDEARYTGAELFTPSPLPEVQEHDLGLWHFDQNLDNAASKTAPPLQALQDTERYLSDCPG
jgi:hypothetical protein